MRRLLLALLLPALVPGQITTCQLSGTVQDAGGGVLPGVIVTLTGEGNGFVRTATTTHEGFFAFPDLTPATFTLSIATKGFKTYRETGIAINTGEERSLGQIHLQLGQVSETVTVKAEVAAVDISTGERSGTLTGDQLDELALRGRDIFDAVSLMPGVVDTSDGRDAPSPNSLSNIYVAGGRGDQKNVTVDGVMNLDTGASNTLLVTPSMDSVAEVKVLQSAYSAEFGRNPASINIVTKGGGTGVHGQASYYFRNEDLNANNFFSNGAGRPRQEYRYNIGSYSIGGPVILPKLLPRRRNVFFFFNQEFQNQVVAYGVQEDTVPTALERAGNFSKSYNTNGSAITVNDPLNGKKAFPGNIIPTSRLTAVGQAILNLFPLPNFVDPNPVNRYNWNYYVAASEPYNRRIETARIDWSPRQNWQLFFSGTNNADHQNVPYIGGNTGFVAGSLNFVLTPISYSQPVRLGTRHSTKTLSPTLFNEASVSESQNRSLFTPSNPALVDRTALGINIPQRNPSLNPLNLIPAMTFSSIQHYANPSLRAATPGFWDNTVYSFIDNLSKIQGTHTLKAGVYFEHTRKLQNANVSTIGSLSFNTDSNNPNDANNSYANALLGNYDSYTEATAAPVGNYIFSNTEWYLQDDWKAAKNLTLSYGVRFYHDPAQFNTNMQSASFSPAAWNPATAPVLIRPATVGGQNVGINPLNGATYPYGLVGDFVPGVGNPADGQILAGANGTSKSPYTLAPVAIGPRLGFAWDPFGDGKTSVRGGGGIYFDRVAGNPTMNLTSNPPTVFTPTQYYGTFADIAASASSAYLAPSGTIYSLASPPHQQQVYNFNLQIDRRVGSNIFSLGYTGSLGRHLLRERNINAVPAGALFLNLNPQNKSPVNSSALSTNFLRPYSAYGDIYLYEFATNSNYNALIGSFQHRISHGLTATLSYTFSKALDTADAYSSAVDPFLDPRSRNYGPAGFNRTQVFTASYHYSLPKLGKMTGSKALGWLTDNWELSGVTRILTGAPLTPGYSLVTGITAPSGTPSETARLEVVNPTAPLAQRFGPAPEPAGQASVANAGPWLSTSTAPQFGNLGQNTVTGPGTDNWDISLYRTVPFKEGRVRTTLRLETYNTFNHTQFNAINSTAQFNTLGQQVNPQFLRPTGARPPRYVQIALRVIF